MTENDTPPVNPAPHLVAFEPCDDWWAVYYVKATDRHGEQWQREAVAGWGIYVDTDGRRFVMAMVTEADVLVPALDGDRFVHLFKSRSAYCNCYDPDGGDEDWSWCPKCGAEIFGRINP